MKVTGVKVTPYACPPAGKPAGRHATSGCIVELLTDSDLTGIAIGADGAGAQIERFVAEMLVGADPRATTAIWRQHGGRAGATSARGLPATTIAALDIALWDLKAKANAEPLWKTLGGTRPRANAHAGGIALTATDQELADWYGSMARDYGLRGAKLRVGLDEEPDLARLALMRTALRAWHDGAHTGRRRGTALDAEAGNPPAARRWSASSTSRGWRGRRTAGISRV